LEDCSTLLVLLRVCYCILALSSLRFSPETPLIRQQQRFARCTLFAWSAWPAGSGALG